MVFGHQEGRHERCQQDVGERENAPEQQGVIRDIDGVNFKLLYLARKLLFS